MRTYDIFVSEGGYRVTTGTYNDCPIIDQAKWYETLAEAQAARDKLMEDDYRRYIEDLAFGSEWERARATKEDLAEADALRDKLLA